MNRKQRRAAARLKEASSSQPSGESATAAVVPANIADLLATGRKLLQARRLAEAEVHYRQVLAAQPNHADALNLLGIIAHQTGRHELAVESIRQAIQQNGRNAGYFSNLGNVLYGHGKLDEAIAAYRQAINLKPDYADAYFNLGAVLREQGKLDDAVAAQRQAIRIKSDYAEAHENLGVVLAQQGKLDEAITEYQRAISIKPDHAKARYNLGLALKEQGKLDEAIAAYRRAISINPDFAEAHYNLGVALKEKGKLDEAVAAYRQAISVKPDYTKAHYHLGLVLDELGKLDEAVAAYRQAISINPDFAEAHYHLGVALKEQGKLDESRNALEKVLELAPGSAITFRVLGEAKRFSAADPHLAAMEKLARDMASLSPDEQIDLHFALAKAYDDLGDHDGSFRHLLQGNGLKRRQFTYDHAAIHDLLGRIQKVFTPELMRDKHSVCDPSPVPVFIIGMPRSGTTLIEQILASHPKVFGAGELVNLANAVERICQPVPFPEAISSMKRQELCEVGTSYVAEIRQLASKAERVTDKLPGNFRYAGLINLVLPNARIIHARRDPLDTCFSCFSTLFAGPIVYSYDLTELGRYYRAYDMLMQHWRRVLPPGVMLEVQYEHLTADLEGEASRIVGHCGLDWNDACLSFHKTERPVRTASAVQVRQPIYRSSIGRARHYVHQLRPLIKALGVDLAASL